MKPQTRQFTKRNPASSPNTSQNMLGSSLHGQAITLQTSAPLRGHDHAVATEDSHNHDRHIVHNHHTHEHTNGQQRLHQNHHDQSDHHHHHHDQQHDHEHDHQHD